MFSHQGVTLFERIRRIRKCGLIGRSMSLGIMNFEVSEIESLSQPVDQDVALSYCSSATYVYYDVPSHDDNGLNL